VRHGQVLLRGDGQRSALANRWHCESTVGRSNSRPRPVTTDRADSSSAGSRTYAIGGVASGVMRFFRSHKLSLFKYLVLARDSDPSLFRNLIGPFRAVFPDPQMSQNSGKRRLSDVLRCLGPSDGALIGPGLTNRGNFRPLGLRTGTRGQALGAQHSVRSSISVLARI
jgi:hypothetical protein